jgi:hypothetical protein
MGVPASGGRFPRIRVQPMDVRTFCPTSARELVLHVRDSGLESFATAV